MSREFAGTPPVQKTPQPRKAIVYCRVSTRRQDADGGGLDSQEAVSREYAARQGYEVVAVFQDKMTGKVRDRPGLRALLAFLRKHRREAITIVIDDLDRFGRHLKHHLELRDLLKEAGGTLESPRMKFGDSPEERLLENVMMSAAQFQQEHNRTQVLGRQRGRLLDGFWPFTAPRGMQQVKVEGQGKVLMRKEPEASVIAEGLEAFASGRIKSQAEFARWLNEHPGFSKGGRKRVTDQQAHLLLTNFLYAGMVEKPDWHITRKRGNHEGLISCERFERIQKRLADASYAPMRGDITAEFPLRGSVACAHCGKPLTACFSKSKTGAMHAYYMCFARGCDRYRKSIRRDVIEADFLSILDQLAPQPKLLAVTKAMFKRAWDQRKAQSAAIAMSYDRQIREIDEKIATALDRILEVSSASVISAFEKRIIELEHSKIVLHEKRDKAGEGQGTFDELFELAFDFLASPSKLWRLGKLEYQKLVMRLVFQAPLAYAQNEGFRTPQTTVPFRFLAGDRPDGGMAERKGFEPSRRLNTICALSRGVPSTTRPPLRCAA
jgi:site-specific DNA recombinase